MIKYKKIKAKITIFALKKKENYGRICAKTREKE